MMRANNVWWQALRRAGPSAASAALIGLVHFVSHAAVAGSPFIIGALIDSYKYTAATTGLVNMLELGSFAAGTALIAPRIGSMSVRQVAYISAIISLLANVWTATADGIANFAVSRVIAGAACGLLYACACAGAARTATPSKTYAFGFAFTTILYSAHFPVLAAVIRGGGTNGAYLYMAGQLLLLLLVLRWLPQKAVKPTASQMRPSQVARTEEARVRLNRMLLTVTMATFCFGSVALWGFTERLGIAAGVTEERVAWIQGLTNLLAIAGTLMPAWVLPRFGFRFPAVATICVTAAGGLGLSLVNGSISYFLVMLLFFGGFNFGYVVFMSYGATLDRSGSVSTAAGATLLTTWAIGAGVGGVIASKFGYAPISIGAGLICLGTLIPLMFLPQLRLSPTEAPSGVVG